MRKKINSFIIKKISCKQNSYFLLNKKAFISFTFDDFTLSAATNAHKILAQNNLRATYYVSFGLLDKTLYDKKMVSLDYVQALYDYGHEIGCHTLDHLVFTESIRKDILISLKKNTEFLQNYLPSTKFDSFAYPKGRLSLQGKYIVNGKFKSARSTIPGINNGRIDLNILYANKLYSNSIPADSLIEMINEIKENGGWLIFYTHDVEKRPSNFGCTPEYFRKIVDYSVNDEIEILPVNKVISRISEN